MDSLITKYSTPSYEEPQSQEQEDDLSLSTPPLSLKFAMPPVQNVRNCNMHSMTPLSPYSILTDTSPIPGSAQ